MKSPPRTSAALQNTKLSVHPHGTWGVLGKGGRLKKFDEAQQMIELLNVASIAGALATSRQTCSRLPSNIFTSHASRPHGFAPGRVLAG
jgi:hypothetical protein